METSLGLSLSFPPPLPLPSPSILPGFQSRASLSLSLCESRTAQQLHLLLSDSFEEDPLTVSKFCQEQDESV